MISLAMGARNRESHQARKSEYRPLLNCWRSSKVSFLLLYLSFFRTACFLISTLFLSPPRCHHPDFLGIRSSGLTVLAHGMFLNRMAFSAPLHDGEVIDIRPLRADPTTSSLCTRQAGNSSQEFKLPWRGKRNGTGCWWNPFASPSDTT